MEDIVHFPNHLGETLEGTFHFSRPDAGDAVVFGHCFTCSRNTTVLRRLCDALAGAGFSALRFDFSGNGRSQGRFLESTYSKQIAEMGVAVDWVVERGARWVGAGGHSLGAVVAVLAAAEDSRLRAVCALAGRLTGITPMHFLSSAQKAELERTGRVSFQSRGRSLELSDRFFSDADRYDPAAAIRGPGAPLLAVHGDRDDIVPASESRRARELNPGRVNLAVVPGADHMFGDEEHRRRVVETVVDWFRQRRTEDRDGS